MLTLYIYSNYFTVFFQFSEKRFNVVHLFFATAPENCTVKEICMFVCIISNRYQQLQGGPRKSSPPSVLHVSLITVLISVFTLYYGPGLLVRSPSYIFRKYTGRP
jgi:hypothetical protein